MTRRSTWAVLLAALLFPVLAFAAPGAYTKIATVYDTEVTGAAAVLTASVSTAQEAGRLVEWVVQVKIAAGSTATTVAVQDSDSDSTLDGVLNSGSNLVAGQLYSFTILVVPGRTYNFEFGATTRVAELTVGEVP